MIANFTAIFILGLAAVYDVVYRRVPNGLVFSAIIGVLIYKFIFSFSSGVESLLGGVAMAVLWHMAWSLKIIGGGDHKLLILVGVVTGLRNAMLSSISVAVLGGGISVAFVATRYVKLRAKKPLKEVIKITQVPYALAVLAGFLFVAFGQR